MRVLLVYKKSSRRNFPNLPPLRRASAFIRRDRQRLGHARQAHARTLEIVQRTLREARIPYKAIYQARKHDYTPYSLILSVGGDGTFLEAARQMLPHQTILGVNSDPQRSVGSFCTATAQTFQTILRQILTKKACVVRLNRLQLKLNGRRLGLNVVNDLLITHERPAAMSRYWLQVGSRQEEQRSSGLWISTAAGSTGAIQSAGGKVLNRRLQVIQYKPRELYQALGLRYRLKGGVVVPKRPLRVGSLMRKGLICVDGEHVRIPFCYGDLLEIVKAPSGLRVVWR